MTDEPDLERNAEQVAREHGVAALGDLDDNVDEGGILPFDPRTTTPVEAGKMGLGWIAARRWWFVGGIVILGLAIYFFEIPVPDLPAWADVVGAGLLIAVVVGLPVGLRLGEIFAIQEGKVISQLDPIDGDQDLLLISMDRWRDLEVYDQTGQSRSRSFLEEVVINGAAGVEVDRYYPQENVAVASWLAGETNRDLRSYEQAVDRIKTQLEEEANAAIESEINAEEEGRRRGAEIGNYLVAVYEDIVEPGERDLAETLERVDLEGEDPDEGLLDSSDLETEIFDTDGATNGNGSTPSDDGEGDSGVLVELGELVRGSDGGDDQT